jgi:hypothetical protein
MARNSGAVVGGDENSFEAIFEESERKRSVDLLWRRRKKI